MKQLFLNLLAQSIHAYQPRNKKLQVRQGRFISSHDCVTCPLEFFFFSFSSKTTEREMGRLYAYCWNRSPTLLAKTTNHQALVRLQKWRRTFIPEGNLGHWDLRSEMRSFTKLLGISLGISYKDHITKEAVRDKIRHAIGPCNDILTTIRNAS